MSAKQDFCSNVDGESKAFVQKFWVQSKTFVHMMGAKQYFCSNILDAKED